MIKFGHEPPKRSQHCPYIPSPMQYDIKKQDTLPENDSPKIGKKEKKCIEEVIGSFLHTGRAIDTTILTALSVIVGQQENPVGSTIVYYRLVAINLY